MLRNKVTHTTDTDTKVLLVTQQRDKKITKFNVSHVASYKFYNQASGYNGFSGTVPTAFLKNIS